MSVKTFTIATFNTHHGKGLDGTVDLARQAKLLAECRPDFIALQEIDFYTARTGKINQLLELSSLLKMPYTAAGFNIPYHGGWFGNGVVSAHPIIFSANIPLFLRSSDREDRGALLVKILWEGRVLNVLSTHFSTFEPDRIVGAEILSVALAHLPKNEPVILAGDLNTGVVKYADKTYGHESKSSYEELEILCRTVPLLTGESQSTYPADKPEACLDYILHSKDLAPMLTGVLKTDASDHYGVWSEFGLSAGKA
jgi:endonuclease/exonuclease/phosphatase family metal-dependent hydrolase